MKPSKEEKFALLKSLGMPFSTSAKAIGDGLSSLVIDMGDKTVAKFYMPNRCGIEQNTQELQNEALILHSFNGHIGFFNAPTLTGDIIVYEEENPISKHFIGYIPMTKLSGRTVDWGPFIKRASPEQIKTHFHDLGSLMASIHEEAKKANLTTIQLKSGPQLKFPWVTDPELIHIIDLCREWMVQNQKEGFVHADLCGHNVRIDKNHQILGALDFSFSGIASNHMYDFYRLNGKLLPPAIDGYEGITGRKINTPVIEMTQIQNLGSYISHLVKMPKPPKELEICKQDFENWVRSIAKDLALQ